MMTNAILKKIVLFGFVLFLFTGFSQETKEENLVKEINKVLEDQPSTYLGLEEYFKAYATSKEKIELFISKSKKLNSPLYLVYGYNSLARYYKNNSNYAKALELHEKSLQIAETSKNATLKIITLNMIASIYRRIDEISKALDYNQKALRIADTITTKNIDIQNSIAVSKNSIGNIYAILKQYDLALEEFKTALNIQKKLKKKLGLAINLRNIGQTQKKLGNLNGASKNFQNSLNYNLQLKNDLGIVICNNDIANILNIQNKPKEALKELTSILPIAINLNDPYYLSITYINIGKTYGKLKDYKNAEKYLNLGINTIGKHKTQRDIIEAHKTLATLEASKGNYKKAYTLYKKYANEEYKINEKQNTLYVGKLLFGYENKIKAYELEKTESESERNSSQLKRDRNILIVILSILSLLSVVLYSMFRSKTLETEKKIVTLEQEALRSQMNPHFVFNALNSIKLYIISNDQKKAVYYLNKFSKLIRKILEASTIREVTLEEELETIKLYMSIENIRFSNEINYSTDIDKNLDIYGIKVPPLVLQPFLENAIWHGLSTKKGIKKVLVKAFYNDDNLIIEVIDNGVGREVAGKIKAEKSIKRKSIGINLTKERLSNFNKDYSLYYSDITENGVIQGTKVTIKIPQN